MRIENATSARPHIVFENREEVRWISFVLSDDAEQVAAVLNLQNVTGGNVKFNAVEILYRATSTRPHERAGMLRALVDLEYGYAESYSLPAVTFEIEET